MQTTDIKFIDKETTKLTLDSFLKSMVFDFEDLDPQNTVLIEKLRKLTLFFNKGTQCYTNNTSMIIGTNHPAFNDNVPNYIMMKRAQGIITKEFAHILYTDAKEFASFLDKSTQQFKKGAPVAKHLLHTLESFRVENRFVEKAPFHSKTFFMMRYPTVKKMLHSWNRTYLFDDNDLARALVDSFSIMTFTKKPVFSKNKKMNALILSLFPLVMKAGKAADTKEVAELATKALILITRLDIDLDKDDISPEAEEEVPKPNSRIGSPSPASSSSAAPSPSNVPDDIASNLENSGSPDGMDSETLEDELDKEIDSQLNELEQEAINSQLINDFLYGEPSEGEKQALEHEEKSITDLASVMPPIHGKRRLVMRERIHRYHRDDYEQKVSLLRAPIQKLVTRISDLKQQIIDDYEYNRTSGYLDASSLARFVAFNDSDIFKSENIEDEILFMNVMILVDCSGSNSSTVYNSKNDVSLPRYQVNQMMAIYLHEAFKKLKFQHSVWGFDSSSTENISPMIAFSDCFDNKSGLNLKDIGARSANRDGYHIRLAGQHLNNVANSEKKLLIVISDGQPSSDGYYGAPAMKDIVDTQEELKKLGVVTAGIFTGSEEENVYFSDMYEKAFFLNNDSIFKFDEVFFKLLSDEFENRDDL